MSCLCAQPSRLSCRWAGPCFPTALDQRIRYLPSEMSVARNQDSAVRQACGAAYLPIPRAAPVSFEVPGLPQTQGSLRALPRGSKVVLIHDNRRLRPWRDSCIWHAHQALAGHGPMLGAVRSD